MARVTCGVLSAALLLAAGAVQAQVPDPLTGATVDAAAALGPRNAQTADPTLAAIYFDKSGKVTDDPKAAAQYAIENKLEGWVSLKKSMSEMSAAERQQLGLAAAQPASGPQGPQDAAQTGEIYGPPAPENLGADSPQAAAKDKDWMVPGSEVTDSATGIEYGTIRQPPASPPAGAAGGDSTFARDGASAPRPAAGGPQADQGGAPAGGPAYPYVAPAVAAQMQASEGMQGFGFTALSLLRQVRDRLARSLGDPGGDDAAAYAGAYDGSAHRAPVGSTRRSDGYFGVAQQTHR